MSTVLITGCSSGIGRALADAFREAGHEVWATARKVEDVAKLQAAGFTACQLDVNDAQALGDLADVLERQGGRLDILINNAGYGAMGPLLDGGVEALQRQFETNVFSVVGVTRALFEPLRRSCGLVINIGSVSGLLVTPFAGAYCASKAAVQALSDALRMELAPFGVGVLEVQPGAIDSRFADNATAQAELLIAEHSPWWPLRDGIRARARASQGRPTPASEVARQVLKCTQMPRIPRLLRVGHGCVALPLMARWLPKGLLEGILRRRFGLHRGL